MELYDHRQKVDTKFIRRENFRFIPQHSHIQEKKMNTLKESKYLLKCAPHIRSY